MPLTIFLLVAFQLLRLPNQPIYEGASVRRAAAPPVTYSAAARFLEQASFGPRTEDVAHLQDVGLDRWLQEQFDATPSPIPDAPAGVTNLSTVQQNFFYNAIHGDDQLRQRVAFALGQIWVISGVKINRPEAFIPYLRLLQKERQRMRSSLAPLAAHHCLRNLIMMNCVVPMVIVGPRVKASTTSRLR